MFKSSIAEIWKPVVGYEKLYSVSTFGRVRRELTTKGATAGKMLVPYDNQHGYLVLKLSFRSHARTCKVHRLVAQAFLPPSLFNQTINHKNGVKTDNRVENLEYMTNADNMQHAVEVLGICFDGYKNRRAV